MKNMSMGDLQALLVEKTPEEILASGFTEIDIENLQNIKYELGICVKWGALTERMYQALMEGMDTLVFLETEKGEPPIVKRNPYEALFDRDKERINGPDDASHESRKYVLLHMTKKLLGALKTRINKELEEFTFIGEQVDGELAEIIQYGYGPDEEEMDLVDHTDAIKAVSPPVINAQIDASKCRHRRTTVKQIASTKTSSRMDELHTFCKDCKEFLGLRKLTSRSPAFPSRNWSKPAACTHRNGSWKEGEEGKTAICSSCDEIVPNPQKFEWQKAGLEPFGDDPELDEIQSFNVLKEMEA